MGTTTNERTVECVHHDRPVRFFKRGDSVSLPWLLFRRDGRTWLTDRYAIWDVDWRGSAVDGPLRANLNGIDAPPEGQAQPVNLRFVGWGEFTFDSAGEPFEATPACPIQMAGSPIRPTRWAWVSGATFAAWVRDDGQIEWVNHELTDELKGLRVRFEQGDRTTAIAVFEDDRPVGAVMPGRMFDKPSASVLDAIVRDIGY